MSLVLGKTQSNAPTVWKAPAKLNLGLRILGRRPDGLHLLESLFWPIDLADEVRPSSGGMNRCSYRWAEGALRKSELPNSGDTVSKALTLCGPRVRGRSYEVIKYIPIGAGLGGGSSDAGCVLRRLEFEPDERERIALGTGADVPFFLDPRPSWVEGIGEKLSRLRAEYRIESDWRFVLCIPKIGTSTQRVFSAFAASGKPFSLSSPRPFATEITEGALIEYLGSTANDLESAILGNAPELGVCRTALEATEKPLFHGFSGTGSTYFGIYQSEALANKATQVLKEFFRNHSCDIFVAKTYQEGR